MNELAPALDIHEGDGVTRTTIAKLEQSKLGTIGVT